MKVRRGTIGTPKTRLMIRETVFRTRRERQRKGGTQMKAGRKDDR